MECSICNKQYKGNLQWFPVIHDNGWISSSILELELQTCHPSCRKLIQKLKKIEIKLSDAEWELYKKIHG
jgi:hypothetical protein